MAKTLLNGVNEVLKRVKVISGDSGALATLTDSARQNHIDVAVQIWNEAIDELYSQSNQSKPLQMAENSITLATGDRDYALQTDLIRLHWPFHEQTNGYYIWEWKEGFQNLEALQLQPAQHTGRPLFGAIRPSDGQVYFDQIPTAEENGSVYTYNYDKELVLTLAADTMPFDDVIFRAMVPVVSEVWELSKNRGISQALSEVSFGRASRLLTRQPQRDSWSPRLH